MDSKQRSILIPHDGSALSGKVVHAAESILFPGTDVTLVHIDTSGQEDMTEVSAAAKQLEARDINVTQIVEREPDAAAALLRIVGQVSPGLVLMATHGKSGSGRFIRGNVAERVMRECPAPLLMINPFDDRPLSFRSVLVPLDSSDSSFEIIPPLLDLMENTNARVTLMFVDYDDPTDTAELRQKRRDQRKVDVSGWFKNAASEISATGLDVDIRIEHGNAADKILELANDAEYDLLAMTTHGRSGLTRWAFGSVAEKVLSACEKPTLLKRVR